MSLAGKLGLTDDLEGRLNKAAELATPKAAAIFGNAISRMSISDAKGILTGPQDSATQYFRRTTTDQLKSAFRPIVDKSLSDVGAVQALKGVTNEAGALGSGLDLDMTSYVMDKALEAIFHYVGAEEAAIRQNPAQRSTDLLKKVFQ